MRRRGKQRVEKSTKAVVGSYRAQIWFGLLGRAVWLRSLLGSCDSGVRAHNRTELQYYIIKMSGFPSPFRPKRHTMALRN